MTDSVNVAVRWAARTWGLRERSVRRLALGHGGQGAADQIVGRHSAAAILECGAHGLLGVARGVAQRNERADGVLRRGARRAGCRVVRPRGRPACRPDRARCARPSCVRRAARSAASTMSLSRSARTRRSAVRCDTSARARAGPTPLAVSSSWNTRRSNGEREAEQQPAVVAHHELRVQLHGVAELGQRLEHGQRNEQLVADPARGHHGDAVERFGGQRAPELGDHERASDSAVRLATRAPMMHASAAATPSAASLG